LPAMSITVIPRHPALGAEVRGVDLRKPMDSTTRQAVIDAWTQHLVLVFPDQVITDQEHVAFTRHFGEPEIFHQTSLSLRSDRVREIFLVSNVDDNDRLMTPAEPSQKQLSSSRQWHTDSSYRPMPSVGSLLHGIEISRTGGITQFINMYKVYEDLPKSLRRNFVPAPDFARAFAEAEAPRDEPLYVALARYLQRVTGVVVGAADFQGVELPAHLSMNFRIENEQGVLAESRDLASIQAQWTGAARVAFSRRADVELAREDVAGFDFEDIPDSIVSSGGLTAFPALVDLGGSVALRVYERRDEALAEHRRGIERLLRRALADKAKQAQRQLPLNNMLTLKWTPMGSAETLRADLVEAALRELFAGLDPDVRTRSAFEHARETIVRQLFPVAIELLALAEGIIAAYAELRPLLQPPLLGFARANYDDLEEQLRELLAPGFLRATGRTRLAQFPRYLKAMKLRAERLRQDPARDQARMLGVQLYWREYLKLRATRNSADAQLDELRWLVEEMRVSTFAQEVRTAESVSPKRLAKLVEVLRG